MTTLQTVKAFLGLRRVAVVGVSRNPKDFTRSLFRELRQRGYDVVPINPNVKEVDGIQCFAKIRDVQPAVEGALLMTQPGVTEDVVTQCAEVGVRSIWMYRAGGQGAVSPRAVAFCESRGMSVVEGECPMMFLPEAGWVHRAHAFCHKLLGRYPR
jgi:predicted CoA-binding protein